MNIKGSKWTEIFIKRSYVDDLFIVVSGKMILSIIPKNFSLKPYFIRTLVPKSTSTTN